MTPSAKARFLHVANGTCTTEIIQAAGIPGRSSLWADPLYEGPVPAGLSDEELLDVRARHLAGTTGHTSVDAVNDLREWRNAIEDEPYDELVLWFEHDLFDQLNLIQVLSWIRHHLSSSKLVSLVCIGSFPGHPRFKGLGELRPEELASLLVVRERVGDAQYTLAEHAWRAFREPTPEALDNLRQTNTSALPFLAAAVTRFLEEYPSTIDGLSRTERRLLRLADPGSVELSAAFPRMHDGEDAYYITDCSFAALVETLSRTSPPLVTVVRGARDNGPVPQGTMTLTDVGRTVLSGRRDRVATLGMDRWLGGVHLQSGADIWRWDDMHGRITRS